MNDHKLNHHDPETESIINQLDALGSQYSSAPDAGFEQRVLDSISNQIAPAPLPIQAASTHQPDHSVFGWRFGLAAAVLLVGGISLLVWSSSRPAAFYVPQSAQQTLISLEESLDDLYSLPDFADEIDSDMDELELMTDAMQTELAMPSVLMEITNSSMTEGSL